MFLYETHMHTYPISACASSSPEEMVQNYSSLGYTGAIITDHFFNGNCGIPSDLKWDDMVKLYAEPYYRAKLEGQKYNFDVFFGMEYGFRGTDFLLYGLTPEFLMENPGFDKLPLSRLSAMVRAEGGYIAQAHPFRVAWWIEEANPKPADHTLLDGIEVHNASMPDNINKKAMDYAKKHGLAIQAGSDAHNTFIQRPSGIVLNNRAESIFDIINAIKSGQVELVK
ncbi:MAG: PHP domain-containing protein [Defluviitaleaceae bacterium]|nr:PHP domain-containing protein [Defluviitaleaceae bacterium]